MDCDVIMGDDVNDDVDGDSAYVSSMYDADAADDDDIEGEGTVVIEGVTAGVTVVVAFVLLLVAMTWDDVINCCPFFCEEDVAEVEGGGVMMTWDDVIKELWELCCLCLFLLAMMLLLLLLLCLWL